MTRDSIYKLLAVLGGCGMFLWSSLASPCVSGERPNNRCRADLLSLNSALKVYSLNAGRPPTTEQGLEALVARPTLEPLPEDWVQIMSKAPMDPWRQPFRYRELSVERGVFRWELRSAGPDGLTGNEDDLAQEYEWRLK